MKKIKAILIGAGARGAKAYAKYALEHASEMQFIAVAEPIDDRRLEFCEEHNIPASNSFKNYKQLFEKKIEADIVLICTQDKMHYEPAMIALNMGYDVLLEKPIGTLEETIDIGKTAKETGCKLIICHVLRYTPFFKKIKEQIDSGVLGDIVAVTHNENVGYFHAVHSYVRGNWRRTEDSSPMILAKSCHDIDILMWLVGDKCKSVSSFGSLMHFKESNAPKDSADRCINCQVREKCPYNSLNIYMDEHNTGWPVNVITNDFTKEGRLLALAEGNYGKCVYRCDNDVVDHQAVIMEFEHGATVTFHMNAFTYNMNRTIRVSGTKGELIGDMEDEKITRYDFLTDKEHKIDMDIIVDNDYGHGGGDYGLMKALVEFLQDTNNNAISSNIDSAVESHIVTFASESSRLEKKIIYIDNFMEQQTHTYMDKKL